MWNLIHGKCYTAASDSSTGYIHHSDSGNICYRLCNSTGNRRLAGEPTGTTFQEPVTLAPIDEQADMLLELVPDVKKVGILYCSAEANSKYQAELFGEAMKKAGIDYEEYTAADSNEIQTVVQNAIESCDALYIPTDNTMASNTDIVKNLVIPAKIPVIAGEQGICAGCGIATLSISYYDLGYKTGEMAYEILANGGDITTMKVESAPKDEQRCIMRRSVRNLESQYRMITKQFPQSN